VLPDGKDNGKGIRLMSSEFRKYLDLPEFKALWASVSSESVHPLALGGLCENHPKFGFSSTVVTTDAIDQVKAEAHHFRSPLVLEPEQVEEWADPKVQDFKRIKQHLKPWNAGRLKTERAK
jgi:putative SOS response-associated peptidase YedK